MSKFNVTISTGNAAFEDAGEELEVARILRELADRIERDGELPESLPVRDINGNRVGAAETTDE